MAFELIPRSRHLISVRGSVCSVRCGKVRISFNKAAAHLLDGPRLLLFWDRENQAVAVQSTDQDIGYPISRNKNNNQAAITCASFLRATGLYASGTIKAEWNQENKRLEWKIPEVKSRDATL